AEAGHRQPGAAAVDDVAEGDVVDGRVAMVADAVGDPRAAGAIRKGAAVDGQVAEAEVDALLDQPPGLAGVGAAEVAAGDDHRLALDPGDGQVAVDQDLVILDEGVAAEQQV